jgi:hypothetical protein
MTSLRKISLQKLAEARALRKKLRKRLSAHREDGSESDPGSGYKAKLSRNIQVAATEGAGKAA